MQVFFFALVLGLPLLILAVAIFGAYFYAGGDEELLDWKPTRSPETEARLERSDVEQMLTGLNRYRRRRGAAEVTLDEVLKRSPGRWEP